MGNFLFIATTDGLEDIEDGPRMEETLNQTSPMQRDCEPEISYTPYRPRSILTEINMSTPTARGQFHAFDPDTDSDEDDSFTHFRPFWVPYNRLEDTSLYALPP